MVGLALLPEPRPKARNLPTRYGARDVGAQANRIRHAGPALRFGPPRLELTLLDPHKRARRPGCELNATTP